MEYAFSGMADRTYIGEQFHRYVSCSIRLWWLSLFSIGALLSLVFEMMIFYSTTSYLSQVNVIGRASTSSLGLTTVFNIIAVIAMIIACSLSAYEQTCKITLKDLQLAYGITDGPPNQYMDAPPSYMTGSALAQSALAQSAFMPAQTYFGMPPEAPGQFDSKLSTPRTADLQRMYHSPRLPSEYSEDNDSFRSARVVPRKKQEAYAEWGTPLQK